MCLNLAVLQSIESGTEVLVHSIWWRQRRRQVFEGSHRSRNGIPFNGSINGRLSGLSQQVVCRVPLVIVPELTWVMHEPVLFHHAGNFLAVLVYVFVDERRVHHR